MAESDERYTPRAILDLAAEMFGGIIPMDPCTTSKNPTGALLWCDVNDDGLSRDWSGGVWVNPPYSRGQIRRWVDKSITEYHSGRCEVLVLLPSDLGSVGGTAAAKHASGLCFVRGRLTFSNPDGRMSAGAKQPSIIAYFGDRQGLFKKIFSKAGEVWTR